MHIKPAENYRQDLQGEQESKRMRSDRAKNYSKNVKEIFMGQPEQYAGNKYLSGVAKPGGPRLQIKLR